jgi:hypothetical protein
MISAKHHQIVRPAVLLLAMLSCSAWLHAEEVTKNSAGVREDIGDIRPAAEEEGSPTFRGTAQLQSQFVTNAKMLGNHSSGDVLFLPTLMGGVNVPLGKKFSFDMLGRAEGGFYSRYDERAFFGFSGLATIDYAHKERWPRLYAGVEPYWYQSLDTGDKLASANGFLVGIEHSHAFNRGKSLVFGGYKFTTYYASPSTDNRDQHTVLAGIAHQFQPSLVGQAYYSFQYSSFRNQSRHDSRNIVGLMLTKQWAERFFTSLSVALVDNDSSQPVAQYQNFSTGLTFTYHF